MAYHHGELPAALLEAVDHIIREGGLDALTLRAVARRAGVSHGAPAHHFGDKKGLLSEYARQGASRLEQCVRDALADCAPDDHAGRLTGVGLGYVRYALGYPGHFRVMFREELLDMGSQALLDARARAALTLDEVLLAAVRADRLSQDDYATVRVASWSLAHGFASLAAQGAFGDLRDGQVLDLARAAFDAFTLRVL